MDALGRITGVVNELGSFTTSTAAQKRAAADGTVLVNDYGSGEKQGTDSLVYLSDHLGSARAWYRVSDGQVGLAEYGAFGQRQLLAAGPGEPERGYTGHLRHAASGLVLAPYRAYDPQLGRWLSEDPIMEAGGLNLYGYVSNNPINLWDPLGLLTEIITFDPVGKGKSSFGHTAINLNGMIYSFGEKGWFVELTSTYMVRNSFRNATGQELNLTTEQEQQLEQAIKNDMAKNPVWDMPHSTCSTKARDMLEEATGEVFAIRKFPLPKWLQRELNDLGRVIKTNNYPKSR